MNHPQPSSKPIFDIKLSRKVDYIIKRIDECRDPARLAVLRKEKAHNEQHIPVWRKHPR